MKLLFYIFIGILLFSGCFKGKFLGGPNYFEDDFENYSILEDLLLPANQFWSFTQLTRTENSIQLDSVTVFSGNKSLRFNALKSSDEIVSKASIAKQKMSFKEGETVRLSARYFIQGTDSLDWLFLIDLEEQTAIGAGPGMRLVMVNNQLRIEYKFNEKDITQAIGQETDFPRNEWIELVWEVKLSQKKRGSVKLWQNGQLIIVEKNKRTLPKDVLYFLQGTKGMYSSCEIGITANSKMNDLTLYVDAIKFEKVN
jgi:hypothetical protein